jgi:threonine dehydratase
VTGLISATTGNHGQSLAFAGRAAGLAVHILVPLGNSPDKNAAMRALGAQVIEYGHDFQVARAHATLLAAADPGLEIVPPFHPDLLLGVATYALELFEAVAAIDTVYVPVGMGSGCCGLIGVRDLLGLPTEIVGVVSERADATARSFSAGEVVVTESADTFIDGVAARSPDPEAIRRNRGRRRAHRDGQRGRGRRSHATARPCHAQRAGAGRRARPCRAAEGSGSGARQTLRADPDWRQHRRRDARHVARGSHAGAAVRPRAISTFQVIRGRGCATFTTPCKCELVSSSRWWEAPDAADRGGERGHGDDHR